jgi:hypothetical protein
LRELKDHREVCHRGRLLFSYIDTLNRVVVTSGMLGEPEKQFFLARVALNTSGGFEQFRISRTRAWFELI